MGSIAEYLEQTVRGLGSVAAGFGLFVVAFFDSSLLSLPEINDVLLIYCGTQFSDKAYYYAFMTVLGSAFGRESFVLARALGRDTAFSRASSLTARLNPFSSCSAATVRWLSLYPPSCRLRSRSRFSFCRPVCWVFRTRGFWSRSSWARSFRYFGEAFLAVRYGEVAITYLRDNATGVLIGTLLVLGAGLGAYVLFQCLRCVEDKPMAKDK